MIPVADSRRQYLNLKNEIDRAIARVHKRGWYILGEEVSNFEKQFAEYVGTKYAVAVGSGTAALHLALIAAGIKPQDEVITVPNTAFFTILAIFHAGARPIFVDIDPLTYTMDAKLLENAITRRTRAIIPVHLYGQCADMTAIMAVASRHNLKVIEDACQAHGAEWRGKKAGSFGYAGAFSFYPSKNLGALGDGGIITTNNKEVYEKIISLRNGGQTDRYHHDLVGFNSRLDEIQAAILSVKLKHLDRWNNIRRKIANIYNKQIINPYVQKPYESPEAKHIYHIYVIETEYRAAMREFLIRKNIQTQIHYPVPAHLQKACSSLGYRKGSFPVSEKISKRILSLPIFPEMAATEIALVIKTINDFRLK